jgi:hypothetical protein
LPQDSVYEKTYRSPDHCAEDHTKPTHCVYPPILKAGWRLASHQRRELEQTHLRGVWGFHADCASNLLLITPAPGKCRPSRATYSAGNSRHRTSPFCVIQPSFRTDRASIKPLPASRNWRRKCGPPCSQFWFCRCCFLRLLAS